MLRFMGSQRVGHDGVSREVPCSALKGETVPDSLPATPKSPPKTAKASRKQSSLSGKERAQGCIPQQLIGRPD